MDVSKPVSPTREDVYALQDAHHFQAGFKERKDNGECGHNNVSLVSGDRRHHCQHFRMPSRLGEILVVMADKQNRAAHACPVQWRLEFCVGGVGT